MHRIAIATISALIPLISLAQKKAEIESRLTELAINAALRICIVDVLKSNVHELRPDGSTYNSFPSRHSVWAYGFGSTWAYYTIKKSAWWGVGVHACADIVGMQRVMALRHWPCDVLAGATIGVGSSLISRMVTDAIYGQSYLYSGWRNCTNDSRSGMTVSTGTTIPIGTTYGNFTLCSSLTTTITTDINVGGAWNAAIGLDMSATPVKREDQTWALNGITLSAGPKWKHCIDNSPWAIESTIAGGYRRYFGAKGLSYAKGTAIAAATIGVSVMLTEDFAIGMKGGAEITTMRLGNAKKDLMGITAGIFTRANF